MYQMDQNYLACVKNNGYTSQRFEIKRGIRQGCPVSALLFVLSVEMLATKIRECPELKGFNIGIKENPIKITQYADDTTLFLNNKDELCTVLNVLHEFGQVAGTKLTREKCKALWLGTNKKLQNGCNILGVKWPKTIRSLGIFLGLDKILNEQLNWHDKIDKSNTLLTTWSNRDLSLYGKVPILKTFAVSQLVQPAFLLPIPGGHC